jgi:hypothetical protein
MSTLLVETASIPAARGRPAAPQAVAIPSALEAPSARQRIGYLLTNPWRNFLIPAGWLRRLVSRSRSPLIAESRVSPGGWRSMEIIYRNAPPVDWFDRQALRENPISMAARNRRRIVTGILSRLIAERAAVSDVVIVGVGAGPGRHVQSAIVESGIDPTRVRACLIDRDDKAFDYGRRLALRLGISRQVEFLQGDARAIGAVLPGVAPHIVKLVGLVEYLSDEELLGLLRALRGVMVADGRLVTHGLVDRHGTGRFLARVFHLKHKQRTAARMTALLTRAGFQIADCVQEPAGVYPIITAVCDR